VVRVWAVANGLGCTKVIKGLDYAGGLPTFLSTIRKAGKEGCPRFPAFDETRSGVLSSYNAYESYDGYVLKRPLGDLTDGNLFRGIRSYSERREAEVTPYPLILVAGDSKGVFVHRTQSPGLAIIVLGVIGQHLVGVITYPELVEED
jgi:hypothetical protein